MEAPLLQLANIHKSFSGVKVLNDVHLEVQKGEVHALMGENGAGKSTVIKIITGIYKRDAGEVSVRGDKVNFTHPKEAERSGITVIHQELNIIPHLTVTENMFLGNYLTYKGTGILNQKKMIHETKENLKKLGVTNISPHMVAGDLSVGKQQMIEIARALATNAELIIMDEPTAALTEREILSLFKVIETLRENGVSVIYVSHRMEEIFKICDRITILRDGNYIGTRDIKETSFEEVVKMMVGREIGQQFPPRHTRPSDEIVLEVKGIEHKDVFSNISFDLKKGEVLGVAGLMGAGRTEIMETLFGYRKIDKGKIYIKGKEVTIKNPIDAIKLGIGFITEDRKEEGLLLDASIKENITLTNFKKTSQKGIISSSKQLNLVEDLMKKLGVRARDSSQVAKSLSGGNQQKVVIAKWLGIDPEILIMDEPTRGVDVGAKKEIYNIMNELVEKGVSIIMVSSELPEILGVSDRILVIHEGETTALFNQEEGTQEKIMTAATGGVKA